MQNNELNSLDRLLYVDENKKIQTKIYRKSDQVVYNNLRQAVMPKSQKIATLSGEIYRTNYCCSNKSDLDKSLKNLENIFLKNEYPKSLINKKNTGNQRKKFSTLD